MAQQKIDWVLVKDSPTTAFGAVGFLNNKVVTVVAFYEDRDGDMDGKVSWGEAIACFVSPVSVKGTAVNSVAQTAKYSSEILTRDPGFKQVADQMFVNFMSGLVLDGIYAVYFAPGISMAGGGIAKNVTSSMIKQLVIRKGFEATVKKIFMESAGR
ncbi:hypothetical protein [Aliiruegeria sabulilitoris]|uniref:hypothetical protein n=1 Tax=Aliiruegeria sabulilitoris TaxID=1510458 RepID=UPI0008319A97|nr:hypothetical protein [Aliiruegeria sabulilitoris]NDR56084.1 hypothetical protein [Pseudoruegeria sp. M32A2M]